MTEIQHLLDNLRWKRPHEWIIWIRGYYSLDAFRVPDRGVGGFERGDDGHGEAIFYPNGSWDHIHFSVDTSEWCKPP